MTEEQSVEKEIYEIAEEICRAELATFLAGVVRRAIYHYNASKEDGQPRVTMESPCITKVTDRLLDLEVAQPK